MNIRPFTKGTRNKELVANVQNKYSTVVPTYDPENDLLFTERSLNEVIRGQTFDPIDWATRIIPYDIDRDNYTFFSGHILKPGVEYMICLLNTYTPAKHALLKNIDLKVPKIRHEYLENIGIFVYRYNPKYTDNITKNESVIDSYCIFDLNGCYLAPNKAAPRPIEDIKYLKLVERNKNKIKELDRDNILSSEEKSLLFKSNFFDNIYNDYCEYIRVIKGMVDAYYGMVAHDTAYDFIECDVEHLICNTTISIIQFNISTIATITRRIPNITPSSLPYCKEQPTCPIDIPKSLKSISTREDEIYHFHIEAPIIYKPDIKYKVIPSITYTTSWIYLQ